MALNSRVDQINVEQALRLVWLQYVASRVVPGSIDDHTVSLFPVPPTNLSTSRPRRGLSWIFRMVPGTFRRNGGSPMRCNKHKFRYNHPVTKHGNLATNTHATAEYPWTRLAWPLFVDVTLTMRVALRSFGAHRERVVKSGGFTLSATVPLSSHSF